MSLRVNTNISGINTHRRLQENNRSHAASLERLSSGLKINRGADAPAQLQISEQLRAQSAGLRQAISNTEMGVSLVQTAEAALDEVSRSLIKARQIAVHAANDATNDQSMLEADQQEIDNIVEGITRIAKRTQYGRNYLLDGSKSGNGVTVGENLEFITGGEKAESSGPNGYQVVITQNAERNFHKGTAALTQKVIDSGEQFTLIEGGRTVNFRTVKGHTVEQTLNGLQAAIEDANLDLELVRPDPLVTDNSAPQFIAVRHKEYGSGHVFTVASSTAGLLSRRANMSEIAANGKDAAGEINGEQAEGKGQVLKGAPGTSVEGIEIRYTGEKKGIVGNVTFAQNSLTFQTGGNAGQTSRISMKSMRASQLANGVNNKSGFASLNDIDVRDAQGSQDAITLIDRAIEEVSSTRGVLGSFQKNDLESNLNYLRIAHENVQGSESVIRDADMAEEMVGLTRNQIMTQSSMAMLAQANQKQQSIMSLIS